MNRDQYDVIGDIHGNADKLHHLLRALGYTPKGRAWQPPAGRQAVFIGDLIDRGPGQLEVLGTVRAMVDAGHARCIMGNHELNAIGWATPSEKKPGEYLRPHIDKNFKQHRAFLEAVGEGSDLHRELIGWFKTLPVALDLGGLRVVHAWWHQALVDQAAATAYANGVLSDGYLQQAFDKTHPAYCVMEGLTKGCEIRLPPNHSFPDHDGTHRTEIRTAWWHEAPRTYRDVAIVDPHLRDRIPEVPLPASFALPPVTGAPVIVGHYWMKGAPALLSSKVACVDYSAAGDGPLVAYRWHGEDVLDQGHFVAAGA